MSKTATKAAAPKVAVNQRPGKVQVATKVTAAYVADCPDTRVPAVVLALLYPLGVIGYLAGWAPWQVAAFAPIVASPVWVATHRAYGNCWYTRVVTLTAGLVPVWLAVASQVGIFHGRVLLGYSVAAVALWVTYAWSGPIAERKRLRRARIDWARFLPQVGLDGARYQNSTQTRLGEQHLIDVRGAGLASSFVHSSAELPEKWAAARALPSETRIVVKRDLKHAGQILIEERTRNPWEETNAHPTLCPDSEWKLPASRSIHDGPIWIGANPSSGEMLGIPFYARDKSCQHAMVIGASGGGKTNLVSNSLEQITTCTDAFVWSVDITKGTPGALWGDSLDWSAGVGETTRAMQILRATKAVIKERSRLSGGQNHHATKSAPLIFLVVDEAGSMQGEMSHGMGSEYRDLLGFVYRSARSAGVCMVFISQRGEFGHTGTGDAKANAAIRICLRVNQESEMDHILPNWKDIGAPNMATYAEGYPGVVAIQTPVGPWIAGRSWNLSDFPSVKQLAAGRGSPWDRGIRLEPAIAAKLGESYAARRSPALVMAGGTAPAVEVVDDIDREFEDMLKASEIATGKAADELAAMRIPKGQEVPLDKLQEIDAATQAANRALTVPDDVRGPVLDYVTLNHPAGVSRADLVRLTEINLDKLKKWLKVMVDQGLVARRGFTTAAVYVLPGPSGE